MKNDGVRSLCDEYKGRIQRLLKIEELEVAETKGKKLTASQVMAGEAVSLRKVLPAGATTVALTRTGNAYDSKKFADLVDRWMVNAKDVAFLIGGANGLDPQLVRESDYGLSLSSLTFPHEIARLVLMEQIYRATSILRGEPYHKGE